MEQTYKNPNENYFPTMSIPPTSATIDASTLGQTSSFNLPPTQQASQFDIMSVPTMADIQSSVTPAGPTQAEQTQTKLSDRLLKLVGMQGGKAQAQQTAEQSAGLPQFQTQINDVNSQIQALQKEAQAIPLQLQNDAQGRGVTAGGLAPIQTAALRNNSIKALGLSAIAQTLQGNIALAQQQADKAVSLQFEPQEAEINYLREALNLNEKNLSREEKKRAESLSIQLEERQRLLNNKKEDKKTVLGFAAEAAKNGAPSVLLSRAQAMNNPQEALALLSQFMSDPEVKANAIMDRKYKQAQIDNIYSNISKSNAETKKLLNEINAPKILSTIDITTPEGRNTGNLLSIIAGNKIDAGTKTQIANTLGVINSLTDLATQRQNGKFEGLNPLQGVADFIFPEFLMSKEGTENRGYLDAINLKVQQWASGASLTKQQTDQVNNLTPSKTDSDAKVKTKMNNLANFMLTQAQSQIQSQGLSYTPEKVDLFITDTLIQALSPEQEAELKAQGLI